MRIIFMGTPDFAVGTLEALAVAGHEVVLAVTQPDKPQGRKQILVAPPVKETAEKLGIPVFQPKRLADLRLQAYRSLTGYLIVFSF